jgi:hypothetical protein
LREVIIDGFAFDDYLRETYINKLKEKSDMNRFAANKSNKVLFLGLAVILAIGFTTMRVRAEIIDLVNYNSAIQINSSSQDGMRLWTVDGHNYQAKQWFWLRVGSETMERSLDTLTYNGAVLNDWDGDHVVDRATLNYADPLNAGLSVAPIFTLQGGSPGSGTSDISEQIRFTNDSASAINLHFFQYCNFILSNGHDSVDFDGDNHVVQTAPVVGISELYNSGEGVVTGYPYHQAALYSTILDSLNDDLATELNTDDHAGPGNATWAFQWNIIVPAHSSRLISKDKILTIVPEPSSILLLSLFGVCLVLGWRHRKRAAD